MPFLPIVLNFIRKNWFLISVVISVLSLYIYVQSLRGDIEDLELSIVQKDAEISLCKSNINDRNTIIEAWSSKTNKDNEDMKSLQDDIRVLTNKANIQIDRIMKQRDPETCSDTIEYFIDMGQRYE